MKSVVSKLVLASALLLGANSSFAERFKINMHNKHLKGENVIKLKQLIKSQHPGARLADQRINIVEVKAKSRGGNGKVKLLVNGFAQDSDTIDGRQYDFNDGHRSTFSKSILVSTSSERGAWNLKLKGNIKLRNIIVTTSSVRPAPRPRPIPSGPFFVSAGSKKVDKFIVDTDRFYVHANNIEAIKISAKRANLEIESVKVHFDNGRVLTIRDFAGYLRKGSSLTHNFRTRHGANIDQVEVNATSTNLIGSRGEIVLELGKDKF